MLGFLHVGCFAFGGAYAAIPLIRDVVLSYGWLTDEELTYMIAVSESTPGPIMVNLATYVGSSRGGLLGSLLATLAVILPAFIIILLIMVVLKNCLEHRYVQAALWGLKPCIIGIILCTGVIMVMNTCVKEDGYYVLQLGEVMITAILVTAIVVAEKVWKKKISPIMLIVVSAGLGILKVYDESAFKNMFTIVLF